MSENFPQWFSRTVLDSFYWLLFMLAVPLVPLVYSTWKLCKNGEFVVPDQALFEVIKHGELLIICFCLLGAISGDLIRYKTSWRLARLIIGGALIIIFYWTTTSFSDIASAVIEANNSTLKESFVLETSWSSLLGTILVAFGTILLPRDL
jgi:hypothetical protein